MIDDFLAWEFSKLESLHQRYDRLWEFVWFCRCEQELNMSWRFFENFEKCIECTSWEHMYLIDNVDFVFSNTWHELRMIDNRSYIINTIIGGSIELDRIYEWSFLMPNTMSTCKTWIATWWEIQALDRFCENTSDWGLASTAWTTKKVAWYKLIIQKCVGKCSFCELLSDDFREGSWAIFLIESHSRHCSQNFYVTNKFENSRRIL